MELDFWAHKIDLKEKVPWQTNEIIGGLGEGVIWMNMGKYVSRYLNVPVSLSIYTLCHLWQILINLPRIDLLQKK